MMRLHLILAAGGLWLALVAPAMSYTKPKHGYAAHRPTAREHSYRAPAHAAAGGRPAYRRRVYSHAHAYHPSHAYGHGHAYSRGHAYSHGHGYAQTHAYRRTYRRPPPPPPVPGRRPDGRYVLPGGLESVCAGGTPPPCQ